MLGQDLGSALRSAGHLTSEWDLPDLDLTLGAHLAKLEAGAAGDFDWVVNCAAFTAVDAAESQIAKAMAVNGVAPGSLAAVCDSRGWRLIHISTDFVFDGMLDRPYRETDDPNPINVYGRSKLAGEKNAMAQLASAVVVRTSWLFGPNGNSFPRTMIRAFLDGKPLRVVADQFGTPTYTSELAKTLEAMISNDVGPGIYHTAGSEQMSWHELAQRAISTWVRVKDEPRSLPTIEPLQTSQFPTPARRPERTPLDVSKVAGLGFPPMRPLDACLEDFCQRLAQP